jgi:RNA polymerase sigma-70 factor (ECF subfamily)
MDDPRNELERTRELLHVIMAQQGEPEAFRWLVDRYEQRLLYFIRRIVDDGDRALDVLQEVWMTVFRRIAALRTPEAFRVWLYRVAHDKAIDQIRGDRRHYDAVGESIDDSTVAASDHAEGIERIENAELIHRLLNRLTPAHREIVTLRFLEQMQLDDIAAVVGCSIGTVKSRLHYALRRLQKGIEEQSHV